MTMSGRRAEQPSIQLLAIDRSAEFRAALRKSVQGCDDIRLTSAANVEVARARLRDRVPDIVLFDVDIPGVEGTAFLREMIRDYHVPVIVWGDLDQDTRLGQTVLDLGAIAVERKPKPMLLVDAEPWLHTQLSLVRRHARRELSRRAFKHEDTRTISYAPLVSESNRRAIVVGIGAGLGGHDALRTILSQLPLHAPAVLVVQHGDGAQIEALVRALDEVCSIRVRMASHGGLVEPGTAWIAAATQHMVLVRRGAQLKVEFEDSPAVRGFRPSVDILFHSIAAVMGGGAVGVVLSGDGDDGVSGLLAMRAAGGYTIGQDQASCKAYQLPEAGIAAGAVEREVPLAELAAAIVHQAQVLEATPRKSSGR